MTAARGAFDVRRLRPGDEALAARTFTVMAETFGEPHTPLSPPYVQALLADPRFWAFAATADGAAIGGLTAHALPLTRVPEWELAIYDIAVDARWQRRGVGRALIAALQEAGAAAGIGVVTVPAEADDDDACAFYRALGGVESAVRFFVFTR